MVLLPLITINHITDLITLETIIVSTGITEGEPLLIPLTEEVTLHTETETIQAEEILPQIDNHLLQEEIIIQVIPEGVVQ